MTKAHLVSPESVGLPSGTSSPSFPLYILDTADGLGSNQIHRIARDHDSRLWLASPVGLASFDGSFIHQWDRRNGLHCNGLRTVATNPDGTVWVGTDFGLELLDRAGRHVSGMDLSTWRFGLCQHIDLGGPSPWIGTAQGLVRLEPQVEGLSYRVAFAADVGFVNDIERLSEQRILAASAGHGLVETEGQTWWSYRCEGMIDRQVSRVAVGRDGELLIGTDDGLYLVDDASATVTSRLSPVGVKPLVTAIAVSPDRYWVAFGRTLVAYAADTADRRVVEYFRVESPVNDLLLDELGNVWIATNNTGLAVVSCLRHAIERVDIGRAGGVYSIKPGPADAYTIGGEQLFGTMVLPPDRNAAQLSAPVGLPETIIWDSLEDASGIWAATQAGLYHAPQGGEFVQAFPQDHVLGAPNRVLMPRGEELWVGTLRGLTRIRDGVPEAVDAGGTPLGYVYAMHLDGNGVLWIATLGRGLWREQQGLQAVTVGPLTADGNTYAVAQGPDDQTIVLQDEKVVLLDRDLSARLVAELPPVAGWTVAWIDAHSLAIGASDGLRILDVASGRVTRHVQALFRSRDWEFTNNRTLVRDRRGRFVCGLSGGLARVDLEQLRPYGPPVCKLVDVLWNGVQPERDGAMFWLRPGRWSLRLRAFSAWFVDSSQVRYQFQLVGFDETWSPLRNRPEVTFTSLPPGEYRLLARAYSPLAGLGPEAELLRLTVSRPLWAKGWTAALASAESLYDWLVRSRSRNQTLLEANRLLEQAVAERTNSLRSATRELETVRDAYQRLSEVDELTQLGNRRNFEKEIDRTMALARRLKLHLALLMVDIDYFKAVNDGHGHQVGDDYLRSVGRILASVIRDGEDVATRFGGEEFAILLMNTNTSDALLSAERIRAAVALLGLRNDGAPSGTVTVSIGVAVMQPEQVLTQKELVVQADRALYRAKHSGRNQVAVDG